MLAGSVEGVRWLQQGPDAAAAIAELQRLAEQELKLARATSIRQLTGSA